MSRKPKNGRPAKDKGPIRNFRLAPAADRAMREISKLHHLTLTATVERAVLFASVHTDFNRRAAA